LRSHSRAIDTAARYGGDEFALVLPEAGRDIAARVVGRVRERLAAEAEPPALSVSAGVAAFPEDGDTPEKLLAAADRALYRMKIAAAACKISRALRRVCEDDRPAMPPKSTYTFFSRREAHPHGDTRDARRHRRTPGVESTFTENVSARGARVVSVRNWEKGEKLTFVSRTGEFRSSARVAYCQPLHGEGYAVGVEFSRQKGDGLFESQR